MTDPADQPDHGWFQPVVGGLAGGLIAGLFGVGGGLILVPILVLWLAVAQHQAHATSLVAVTIGAAAAVFRFAFDGAVALWGALPLAAGAIAGAWAGARLLPYIPERRLRAVFAVVVFLLALRFLLVGSAVEAADAGRFVPDLDGATVVLHVLGGLGAGVVSSVMGVGGGVVMVPLLVLGFGYGQQVGEGTSLAVIVPTALTGALSHHRHGYTQWGLGLKLGVGSLLGGVVGAEAALALAPEVLSRLYGGLQLVVAVLMVKRIRDAARERPHLDATGETS